MLGGGREKRQKGADAAAIRPEPLVRGNSSKQPERRPSHPRPLAARLAARPTEPPVARAVPVGGRGCR
eukprot:1852018-Pyramimonas_sp.AAC.1